MSKRNKSLSDRPEPILRRNFAQPPMNFRVLSGVAIIAACVFIAYLPAINGDFIWDDDKLLTENQLVKAPEGLSYIWCTNKEIDFWPVTNSAFWLEWRLWEMNPLGYHVTNLILHTTEALLVWLILRKLSIPGAYLAALIFALHPVNVESVAWIASRKNLMAMLFFQFSILWYFKFIERACRPFSERCLLAAKQIAHPSSLIPDPSSFNRWYFLSLAAFLLAMLGKGSAVVLPVLLVGIVWWLRPLKWRDFAWISPFFVLAGILTRANMWFQVRDTGTVFRAAGLWDRILGARAQSGSTFTRRFSPWTWIPFIHSGISKRAIHSGGCRLWPRSALQRCYGRIETPGAALSYSPGDFSASRFFP